MDVGNNKKEDFGLGDIESKINGSFAPDTIKTEINQTILRLRRIVAGGSYTEEIDTISKYVEWIIQLPWGVYSQDNLDIDMVKSDLDKNHYGLETTKQRILEHLAVLKLNENKLTSDTVDESMSKLKSSSSNAPILCFLGIQGVGKTSLAKSIANAIGRQFYRISLGGLSSVSALRGIPKNESDSEPGQIIKALIRTGSMNPMILLDEVVKVSTASGARSDVMAALLEILDPEQNSTFVDHYLDFPVDLSKVIFVTTANNINGITAALLDRQEIIRFSSYSDEDKIQIGKNYMLSKVRKATGLTEEQFVIDEEVWPMIVRPLGFDAGIRELERTVTNLCRKVAMIIVKGQGTKIILNKENFREFIPDDFGIIG